MAKLNDKLKKEVIKKYQNGCSIRKISKEMKLKKDIIKELLEKENITQESVSEVAITSESIDNKPVKADGVQSGVQSGVPILSEKKSFYIDSNFEILIEMIEGYKKDKNLNIKDNQIYLELPLENEDEKDFKTSIRVNKKIWEEFKIFCKDQRSYTQKELVSMALKEYMGKYKSN